MEDLNAPSPHEDLLLPNLTQYGVHLPFRVAVVGQTDSGKTHLIMGRWLGRKISFWMAGLDGDVIETYLCHCLYCSNGGMSLDEKSTLLQEFVCDEHQKLFHINRFLSKKEIFEFISRTSKIDLSATTTMKGKSGIKRKFTSHDDFENVVFGEGEKCAPNCVIILDNLMTEAFNTKDNDTMMNLLMTKLSHHNNLSVLIVCHELYPKGKNSILFREQLTSVHLHSIMNQQKVK